MAAEGEMLDAAKQPLLEEQDAQSGVVSGREWMTRWILLLSLLLNVRLWLTNFSPCSIEPAGPLELSGMIAAQPKNKWAHTAAAVAETLSAYDCSGHGSVLWDTIQPNDHKQVVCECHLCFTGPTCSESVPDCSSHISSGDPVLYEYFWKQNAEAGTLVTPPWYRMSYSEGLDLASGMTTALKEQIRALHKMVGNVIQEDKHLLISSGSSHILFATMQALSAESQGPTAVVGAVPFYELYRRQSDLFGNGKYAWGGAATTFDQQLGNAAKTTIEFVTHPNNPDFLPRGPVLNRSNSHTVYDFAYNWPHMSSVNRTFDEDIMIFTLSKLTGHAGTRLGWGFFKDANVAKEVETMLTTNNMGVSHDAMSRGTQLLKAVLAGYSNDIGPVPLTLPAAEYAKQGKIFHYGRAALQQRYEWLVKAISQSSRFSMVQHEPEYCAFFGQTLPPSPAYAWLHCTREEEEDCYNLFLRNGIRTYPGEKYGLTNRYVRFSLLKRDSDYELLEKYLPKLVAG